MKSERKERARKMSDREHAIRLLRAHADEAWSRWPRKTIADRDARRDHVRSQLTAIAGSDLTFSLIAMLDEENGTDTIGAIIGNLLAEREPSRTNLTLIARSEDAAPAEAMRLQ